MADECCVVCGDAVVGERYLRCGDCSRVVHSLCVGKDVVPFVLVGDNFYRYRCRKCAPPNGEYQRFSINWVDLIQLTLYNLLCERESAMTAEEATEARGKFFRWREDICKWIDVHWDTVTPGKTRTATWGNTVASYLSVRQDRFLSGATQFKTSGWWTLQEKKPPVRIDTAQLLSSPATPQKATPKKIKSAKLSARSSEDDTTQPETIKRQRRKTQLSVVTETIPTNEVVCDGCGLTPVITTRTLPDDCAKEKKNTVVNICANCATFFNRGHYCPVCAQTYNPRSRKPMVQCDSCQHWIHLGCADMTIEAYNAMAQEEDLGKDLSFLCCVCKASQDDKPLVAAPLTEPPTVLHRKKKSTEKQALPTEPSKLNESSIFKTEEQQPELEDEPPKKKKKKLHQSDSALGKKDDNTPVESTKLQPGASITTKPIIESRMLSSVEEFAVMGKLEMLPNPSKTAARFLRKLKLRRIKRTLRLPLFDLDVFVRRLMDSSLNLHLLAPTQRKQNVVSLNHHKPVSVKPEHDARLRGELDRYNAAATSKRTAKQTSNNNEPVMLQSFSERLLGLSDERRSTLTDVSIGMVQSPHTFRRLKPFIRRDWMEGTSKLPPKLAALRAVEQRQATLEGRAAVLFPVDYCYMRKEHLGQVNLLLHEFFWPGIDMSEALDYPDFSVVVCYKRLVIGCAFMTPGAYISYILVHPDWQGAGIASFMVYHLSQTCLGKDVTLHVSANNPAMLLYQKFGFKPEEFIVNFYDKYYPNDSPQSKNALFIRLRR